MAIKKTRVLFVCIGNSCRSPMAEAIAQHLAPDLIESSSAGLVALGEVMRETHAVLHESGVPCAGLTSKSLHDINLRSIDLVINLSGRPINKYFDGARVRVEDWDVGDPYGFDLSVYRNIRDEIERRVTELIDRLKLNQNAASAEK
jgi:arsenate reductase